MKQNVLLGLVAALTLCVGILFYLQFKGNSKTTTVTTPSGEVISVSESKYLFINMDSVATSYNLTKDKTQAIQSKGLEREQRFRAKEQAYTAAMKEYEVRQRYDTERQLQPLIEKIQRLQQELMQMEQSIQQELMLDQQALEITITDSLKKVAQEIAIEKNADFIVTSAASLYYNPAMDVTKDAIEKLNNRYQATKSEEITNK